jgi:IS5 family transposase
MDSFATWVLRGLNAKQGKSRLLQISDLIDWAPIRHSLDEMYDNKSEKGGRPNCDVILMFKILILQQWYGLSDLEIERQMADRLSFIAFLGFPNPFPDSRTIWLFRERMARTGKDKVVWAELQRQLDAMGLQVKRGTIQDATFIEADPGPSNKPRGGVSRTEVRGSFDAVETKPRLAAARMALGPRKVMKFISATSCIKRPISTTA